MLGLGLAEGGEEGTEERTRRGQERPQQRGQRSTNQTFINHNGERNRGRAEHPWSQIFGWDRLLLGVITLKYFETSCFILIWNECGLFFQ